MNETGCIPKTYINHPNNWKFQRLLQNLFKNPDPNHITEGILTFLKQYPLVLDDFPPLEGTYSRTILYRHENGYEAMAARWSPGAVSSIHGHPHYAMIMVVKGSLGVDNFIKTQGQLKMKTSSVLSEFEFFSDNGDSNAFNNHIHRVQADEETLSIHISSDDAAKGETYTHL